MRSIIITAIGMGIFAAQTVNYFSEGNKAAATGYFDALIWSTICLTFVIREHRTNKNK